MKNNNDPFMSAHPGAFPTETIIAFVFACAIVGGSILMTTVTGRDWIRWWQARSWTPTTCTILETKPGIHFRYSVNGRAFESSTVSIRHEHPEVDSFSTGATQTCWFNPENPAQALLHREYSGWWWLPVAYLLSLLMLSTTGPAFFKELWLWATYRPDPPLSWPEWLATFYRGNGWMYSTTGLALIVPGLLMFKFATIDPWWNWWQAQSWTETPCRITKVEARRWTETTTGAGFGRSGPPAGGYLIDIAYSYEFGGQTHVGQRYSPWRMGNTDWLLQTNDEQVMQQILNQFSVGSTHPCYVSSTEPTLAYLFRGRTSETDYVSLTWSLVLTMLGLCVLAARN